MNAPTDALWFATAAMALAAAAMTVFGLRQAWDRGFAIWVGSMWAAGLGVALTAFGARQAFAAMTAYLLLLQWPVLTLVGLRRFHARIDWPGRERVDVGVLLGAALLAASSPVWPAEAGMQALAVRLAHLATHLYTASLLVCCVSRRDGMPLRALAVVMALAALAPTISAPGAEALPGVQASAVATALASVAATFIVTLMVFDRSDRQSRATRRRLRMLANIDALTNVPNRRHFEELANRILRSDPPGRAALLMFDIDHFKRINDTLGHAAGDRALRLVSRCLLELARVQDLPCRHGGDEFALLLRNATVGEALTAAQRLVARLQVQHEDPRVPPLTLSFGVVQIRPTESIAEALRRADQALYEAKRQGRSRAVAAAGSEASPLFTDSRPLGLTTL